MSLQNFFNLFSNTNKSPSNDSTSEAAPNSHLSAKAVSNHPHWASSCLEIRKRDLRSPSTAHLRRGSLIHWIRILLFVALDFSLLSLARFLAEYYGTVWSPVWNAYSNWGFLISFVAIEIAFLAEAGLYREGDYRRNYMGLVKAISFANILLLLIAFLYQPKQLVSRSTFLLSWVVSVIFVFLGRLLADATITFIRKRGVVRHPVFVFCHPDHTRNVLGLLERSNFYVVQGWADIASLDEQQWEHTIDEICSMGISEVFICTNASLPNFLLLYWSLRNAGITLHLMPVGLQPLFRKTGFWAIQGVPLVKSSPPLIAGIDFWIKRGFDLCFAVLLLLIASPVYLVIALLIKLDSPGPIFYRQNRVGLHSRPFKAWKFRTMVTNADRLQKELEARNETKDGILFKIKEDPRITKVGRILRRYSLDELPQVFNVLLGEMSFVGPRPLPLRDVEKFSKQHFIRHEVLPGITGLWQVSGRSDIDNFDDVLKLDIAYMQNWSLWLDLKIILQTVKVVLLSKGAY